MVTGPSASRGRLKSRHRSLGSRGTTRGTARGVPPPLSYARGSDAGGGSPSARSRGSRGPPREQDFPSWGEFQRRRSLSGRRDRRNWTDVPTGPRTYGTGQPWEVGQSSSATIFRSRGGAPSPPLPASKLGYSLQRSVTKEEVLSGQLGHGVVIFPSGNMIITGTGGRWSHARDIPDGNLEFIPLRAGVDPHSLLANSRHFLRIGQLKFLLEDFEKIRMRFPIRCRHKVCATLKGPLRELFQNNLTIPGKFRSSLLPWSSF